MQTFLFVSSVALASALVSRNTSRPSDVQSHPHKRTVILPDAIYAIIAKRREAARRTVKMPDAVYDIIAKNARASAETSEITTESTVSAKAAEGVVVSRLAELTSEMQELKRENNRVSRRIIAGAKEIRTHQNKTDALLKANNGLSAEMDRLQQDTEERRRNLTNNWNKIAQLAQHRDEIQAQAAQEDIAYKAGKAHIQAEEEIVKQNETAFEEQAEAAKELAETLQNDMKAFEKVNTEYKDRSTLLKQIQGALANETKLENVIEFLKHENKSLMQDQKEQEDKIMMLRSTLVAERQRRLQVTDRASTGAQKLSSLKEDRRKDKAQLVAQAVAAEETLAKQHTQVEQLQEANGKLQAQLDARIAENARLQRNNTRIEAADRSVADRRAERWVEMHRLSEELRSEMGAEGVKSDDTADGLAGF